MDAEMDGETAAMVSPTSMTSASTWTSTASSTLASVAVCMSILAVSAVAYFAIRCYFEDRRFRSAARLCKCRPVAVLDGALAVLDGAVAVDCADLCTYSEKRATCVATQTLAQTSERRTPWSTDVRASDGYARTFNSPPRNNDDIPSRRPPATGSSVSRQLTGQQPRRYRRQRPSTDCDRCPYAPSIAVMSPSSGSTDPESNSSLVLPIGSNSRPRNTFALKHFGMMGASASEEDEMAAASPYHPRYNTPVSLIIDDAVDAVDDAGSGPPPAVVNVDVEMGLVDSFPKTSQFNFRRPKASVTSAAAKGVEFETWPCGRLITRWTQTERGGSVLSLDWDHYDVAEQMRTADDSPGSDDVEPTLLQASRTSRTSRTSPRPQSPYVLCYECNDEFVLSEDRSTIFWRSPGNSSLMDQDQDRDREPLDLSVNSYQR